MHRVTLYRTLAVASACALIMLLTASWADFDFSQDEAARGGVRLWDANSGACIAAWRHGGGGAPGHALAFASDGRALVSAAPAEEGGGATLCVWSVLAASQQRPATVVRVPGAVAFKLAQHAGGGGGGGGAAGLLLVGAREAL